MPKFRKLRGIKVAFKYRILNTLSMPYADFCHFPKPPFPFKLRRIHVVSDHYQHITAF